MGHNYEIVESDMLEVIEDKLKNTNELNKQMQDQVKAYIMRPSPVKMAKATKQRVFYYEPIYILEEDLVGADGTIIHKQGTKVNSLDYLDLSHNLLFIDGDDQDQLEWALTKAVKSSPSKIILINGNIGELTQQYKLRFYFDQKGIITTKLAIKHVPAIVIQAGRALKIVEEVIE